MSAKEKDVAIGKTNHEIGEHRNTLFGKRVRIEWRKRRTRRARFCFAQIPHHQRVDSICLSGTAIRENIRLLCVIAQVPHKKAQKETNQRVDDGNFRLREFAAATRRLGLFHMIQNDERAFRHDPHGRRRQR